MEFWSRRALTALIVLLAPLPIYLLRLDDSVGMMLDDAWYIMLGKALAQGDGYRLINSPVPDILPMYPPGFPALLSLAFRVNPSFPHNLWLLKSISIAAMLGAGLLSYLYLHRDRRLPRHLAACVSIAITTTPALVFLATSTVMSECVFTLVQLGAVVVAHRAIDASEKNAWRLTLSAALLAAVAVLIRSAGVSVLVAIGVGLLKERRWARATGFAMIAVVCLLPWSLYVGAHAPTPAQQAAHRGSILYGYSDQFWMRRAGASLSGRITAADLPERVATNLVDVFARGVGGLVVPTLLRGAEESGEEVFALGGRVGIMLVGFGSAPANLAISLVLSAIALFGYLRTIRERVTVAEVLVPLSLAITILWPWWTFRFVIPLTPFLFFYFIQGLRWSPTFPAARVVLLSVIGLNLYDHAGYTIRASSPESGVDWLMRSGQVNSTLDWMGSHLEKQAVVATTNPPLVYLRTGHRTIMLDSLTEKWSVWKDRGVRYVACLTPLDLPDPSMGPYTLLHESSGDAATRVWVIGLD